MNPSQVSIDPEGNVMMAPAVLVAVNATTTWFRTGQGGAVAVAGIGVLQGAPGSGVSFEGGSGRNVKMTTNGAADLQDHRWFTPSVPDVWDSAFNGALTVTRDPSTGALSLADGTDEIAASAGGFGGVTGVASAGTFPITNWVLQTDSPSYTIWEGASDPDYTIYHSKTSGSVQVLYFANIMAERVGGSTTDPSGVCNSTVLGGIDYNGGSAWTYTITAAVGTTATLSSTAYGEATYNASAPFTIDIEREAGTEWTARMAVVAVSAGTAQAGYFTPTGWGAWESVTTPAWTQTLDGVTGEGALHDGTDVVMTRDAGPLYDPAGAWVSTAYGEATYNGGDPFTGVVGFQRAASLPGVIYVTMARNAGTGEATGLTGPFWTATTPPMNTTTEIYWPVAEIDAQGVPFQIQFGPIVWVPNP